MLAKFALRIIGRSQKHSFRSIIGLALIISMMVATSGVISGLSVHIFGITKKAGESPSIYIQSKDPSEGIPAKVLELLNHTNINQILPVSEKIISLSSETESFNCYLVGTNVSEFMSYYSWAEVSAGRLPRSNTNFTECLVGKDLSTILGTSGITISKGTGQLLVVGIIQNVKEFQNTVIIDIADYTKIFNQSLNQIKYQRIKISLKNGYFIKETINYLNTLLKDYLQTLTIKPEQQADIFTSNLFSDVMTQLNLLFGILFIITLIRTYHAISWFVQDYERDLLIMRSMGLSSSQLAFLIIFLAEVISNIGFLIGTLFGILIPSLIFTLIYIFSIGGFLVPEFNITVILTLFILSNIVTLVAVIFPVLYIIRKKPSTLSLSRRDIDR
ncbi:MAG: ABC transporter permease [Promethearchaeota archaeon]